MYRHRGHRYITTRRFDLARADLRRRSADRGQADQVEPDGQPNPPGIPRSTLHFNVWYHLGLTYYLQGDFAKARDAYLSCMAVSKNDDAVVATSDWLWMTLMRLGRKDEAAKVLERITPKMDILENGAYHRRLLMYKGLEKPEALLEAKGGDATHRDARVRRRQLLPGDGDRERARASSAGHLRNRLECVRLHRGGSGSGTDATLTVDLKVDGYGWSTRSTATDGRQGRRLRRQM